MDTTRLPESEVLVFRILVSEKLQLSEVNLGLSLMIFHSTVSSKLWKMIKKWPKKGKTIPIQFVSKTHYFFSVPVSGAQIHLDSNNYILRDDLFYVIDLFIQSRINVLLVSLFFHESILSINHTKLKCKSCIKCDT